jgi:hypothetical protein
MLSPNSSEYNKTKNSAAFICVHCMDQGAPIAFAQKDEPIDECDTGWQFLCGIDQYHDDAKVMLIVAIKTVVGVDASVLQILDSPVGSQFARKLPSTAWKRASQ